VIYEELFTDDFDDMPKDDEPSELPDGDDDDSDSFEDAEDNK
jgi:hypothetical protein